jgi:CDP-diacylglycerol--glycerol-3-phosphate 3-phosphatidyltransferase
MTMADTASFVRLLLGFCSLILLSDWPYARITVLGITVIAAGADLLDGYLARKHGTVSNFGIFIDLTADKVFVCSILVVLSMEGTVPVWMTVAILSREFVVMGSRSYAAAEGFVLPAQFWGKLKTNFLFASIFAALLRSPLAYWLLLVSIVLAYVSCIDYAKKVRSHVSKRSNPGSPRI